MGHGRGTTSQQSRHALRHAGLGALILLAACGRRPDTPEAVATPPALVEVAPVTRGDLVETVRVAGVLQAAGRVSLTCQLPGRVLAVPVKEGERVPAGTVLVRLDPAEVEGQIARAQAGVTAARAQLAKARAGQEAARAQARAVAQQAAAGTRAAEAVAEQAAVGVELDRAAATGDLATAEAGLEAARAALGQAQLAARLAEAEADADVAAARAGVQAAEADVQRAQAGAEVVDRTGAAEVDQARAALVAAEANLQRVRAGARPEQVAAAEAQVEQARAGRDQAARQVADLTWLHERGGVAGAELAGAKTQLAVAEASLKAAEAQLRDARAGATAAERAAAEAQVEQARAGVAAAEAARDRIRVARAEVEAAQAQVARARAGLTTAEQTRRDRLAVAAEQVKAAEAQVARAQAGLTAATAATGRTVVRQAEVKAAQAQVETARAGQAEAAVAARQAESLAADIAAAAAGLAEAEAQWRLALEQRQRATLTAPVTGVVAELHVQAGDTVLPGMPLVVVESPRAAELEALATADQRPRLAPGQRAEVRLVGDERVRPGTVREVADVAEADGRSFKIRVLVDSSELAPGLRATADITVAERHGTLLLPAAAIQSSDGAAATIFVRRGDRAQRREITLGLTQPEQVEVLEGLAEGDEVIWKGARALVDGAAIEVRHGAGR